MPKTTTSTLALAALLAAGTAGTAIAQATAPEETAPATEAPAAEGEATTEEAPAEGTATTTDPEPAEGEADVTIIQEGGEAEPAEGEAEVVVEEEPAGDTVITTDPEAVEGEATVTEEVPAEGALVPEEEVVEEEAPAVTDPAITAPAATDPAVVEEEAVVVEEVEQPVEGQILEQSPEQVMAETLLDATVMSPEGETIGEVTDMVLSAEGQVEGVVVGVGGFLGIGQRNVAMEFGQIEVVRDEAGEITFVLNATREEIENAPQFRTLEEIEAETATGDVPATGATTPPGGAVPTPPAGGLATEPVAPAD